MRALIVDDMILFRDLMRTFLVEKLGHDIVGEATTGKEAVEMILRLEPHFVFLDLHLPDMSGFDVVDRLNQAKATLPTILPYSAYCDDHTTYEVERHRMRAFLYKPDATIDVLSEAIQKLTAGGTFFSKTFVSQKDERKCNSCSYDKVLTSRQLEVAGLVGELLADKQIAKRLRVAVGTVEKHRLTAAYKLGLKGRRALESYARDHGLSNRP